MRSGLQVLPGIAVGLQIQASSMSAQIYTPKTPGGTILTVAFIGFCRSLGGALGGDLGDTVYNVSMQKLFPRALARATPKSLHTSGTLICIN